VRGGIAALLIAAAVVLFIVLSDNGGGDESASGGSTPTAGANRPGGRASVPTIQVRGGKPVGGVQELTAASGGRVRFRVTSDLAGEVHVHGYEIEKPIAAGGEVSFAFPASIEGGFEVELHHGGGEEQIADLRVEPG
jgi:hypothetical protein